MTYEEKYILDSIKIHNGFFDYSKVVYKSAKDKVIIICPIHGEFEQCLDSHSRGIGCKQCGVERRSKKRLKNTEWFIKQAIKKHGDVYDYSIVTYKNSRQKIDIICPIHGIFSQLPTTHLRGSGCNSCADIIRTEKRQIGKECFIKRASKIHKGKFSYENIKYKNIKTKITLNCSTHGNFEILPLNHLSGAGCPSCRVENSYLTTEQFILKSNITHNYKYDYSLTEYIHSRQKLTIICPIHGEFRQIARNHIKGSGCSKCADYKVSLQHADSPSLRILKLRLKHGDRYEYPNLDIKNNSCKIKIICKKHGEFIQGYSDHLSGQNCPKCSNFCNSKGQAELFEFIKSLTDTKIIENDKEQINPKHLDIYDPSTKTAFEFNGLYYHTESGVGKKDRRYHLSKTTGCREQGIHLYHIFDFEWHQKKDIIKSLISCRYGFGKRYYARKLAIRQVPNKESLEFLNNNHLQGNVGASVKYGLYDDNELISLMTFGKSRYGNDTDVDWELIRLATKLNCMVIGGSKRMFAHFVREYKPKGIVSYCDKRFFTGKIYEDLGFIHTHDALPNYFYVNGYSLNIKPKSRVQFQKHKLKDKLETFNPELTEYENMVENGWDRFWDCGNSVFKWTNHN